MRGNEVGALEGMALRTLKRWARRPPELWTALAGALGAAVPAPQPAKRGEVLDSAARAAGANAEPMPAEIPPGGGGFGAVKGGRFRGKARAMPWTWMAC